MNYPIITKENFDEITDKILFRKNCGVYVLRVSVPRTRKDFFDMTKNMYGVGLGVIGDIGRYRIDAIEDIYSELEIPKLWDKKYGQYNGLKPFLAHTFNSVSCGGVSNSHYGQFNLKGYRHKLRLINFWKSEFVPSENIAMSN